MDETTASEKGLIVLFGQIFINRLNNFPVKDQKKIFEFVEHLKTKSFAGLAGRNKTSVDVDKNDSDFLKKSLMPEITAYSIITLAFRITINQILLATGLLRYILHYKYSDDEITLLDLDSHPPFTLPAEKFLI